jgi:hypothetical protein
MITERHQIWASTQEETCGIHLYALLYHPVHNATVKYLHIPSDLFLQLGCIAQWTAVRRARVCRRPPIASPGAYTRVPAVGCTWT